MADTYARVMNIYGSEADWASNDIVLLQGEIAFANVGGVLLGKIGDGTSLWSQLEYTLGAAAVPLAGTNAGQPITGILNFESVALGKEFVFGIVEGLGIDDFVLGASGGTNLATSNIYISVNSLSWQFGQEGKLTAPDIVYGVGDDLVLANKKYVDAQVAGGVSATYIPLAGNSGGLAPVTGLIEHYNSVLDKEYTVGILNGFGIEDFIITSSGTNEVNCKMVISMNDYQYWFMNTGRLLLPVITYGSGDDQAAATKAFVDELRQDCINAGLSIPAVV